LRIPGRKRDILDNSVGRVVRIDPAISGAVELLVLSYLTDDAPPKAGEAVVVKTN
jgi:hypothetical protein